jgi:hypothetical protein
MNANSLSQRKMPEEDYSTQDVDDAGSPDTEAEILRQEIASLRQEFEARAARTEKLVGAYKLVLSDMADLIEAERLENVKREESIRFFMSSAETRLKAEIREELGFEDDDQDAPGHSWWPFRKYG